MNYIYTRIGCNLIEHLLDHDYDYMMIMNLEMELKSYYIMSCFCLMANRNHSVAHLQLF